MTDLIWAIVLWVSSNLAYLSGRLNQAQSDDPATKPFDALWCAGMAAFSYASAIILGIGSIVSTWKAAT